VGVAVSAQEKKIKSPELIVGAQPRGGKSKKSRTGGGTTQEVSCLASLKTTTEGGDCSGAIEIKGKGRDGGAPRPGQHKRKLWFECTSFPKEGGDAGIGGQMRGA